MTIEILRAMIASQPHNVSDSFIAAREAVAEHDRLSYNPGMTVDRLLGMADQFIEDWNDDAPHDPTMLERKGEWDEWRPRIVACVEACVAIAVLEVNGNTEPDILAHSIDSIIGTAQGALK